MSARKVSTLALALVWSLTLTLTLAVAPAAAAPKAGAVQGARAPKLGPKERLGKLIFEDTSLSSPPGQDCGACHGPEAGWTGPDARINAHGGVYEGVVKGRFGNRKPPSSAYASFSPDLHQEAGGRFVGGEFWDGRAANIAQQAKGPFLNPVEQNDPDGATVCAKVSSAPYRGLFEQVFGPGSLDCAKDAQASFERIAQAVAAFEASPESNRFSSRYDAYLAGQTGLSAQELRGLALFEGKAHCARCHPSRPGPYSRHPLFTDYGYYNLGVPSNPENPYYRMPPEINPEGAAWVDPGLGGYLKKAGYPPEVWQANRGRMKVPTLRNVDKRPSPGFVKCYGHNGYFKDLRQMVEFINSRDVPSRWPAPEVPQNLELDQTGMLSLKPQEIDDLTAFLGTLSDK